MFNTVLGYWAPLAVVAEGAAQLTNPLGPMQETPM